MGYYYCTIAKGLLSYFRHNFIVFAFRYEAGISMYIHRLSGEHMSITASQDKTTAKDGKGTRALSNQFFAGLRRFAALLDQVQ